MVHNERNTPDSDCVRGFTVFTTSHLQQALPLQEFIVGATAWQAALHQLVGLGSGHAYTQLACKLAGRCPYAELRDQVLVQLVTSKPSRTALAGVELVSQGRQMSQKALADTLHRMQSMLGSAGHGLKSLHMGDTMTH